MKIEGECVINMMEEAECMRNLFKNTDRDFLNYQKIIENDFIMIRLAVIWTIMNCLNN
jgi:hypothetical protein